MSNNENDNLDGDLIDILKFQYQELREERNRNTTISYATTAVLIPAAFLILLSDSLKLLSPVLVFFAYLIDRRFNYYNKLRSFSMMEIEKELERKFKDKKKNTQLDFIMNVVGLYQCEGNLPDNYKGKLNEFWFSHIPITNWIIKNIRVSDCLLVLSLFLLIIVVWPYLKSCV